jgi:hypothetical protein
MKNKLKTLVAVTVLGAATLGLYSGVGAAADNVSTTSPAADTTQPHRFHHHLWMMHHHHAKSPWHLGLNRDKHLTESDARIITEAALLMRGHHDLQVGTTIETKMTKHGHKLYIIDIVNQQNKSVNRVVLNSMNGHIFPLAAMQKFQR